MTENLLNENNISDLDSDLFEGKNFFEFNKVSYSLKHIYSKSKIRTKLANILSKLYSYPILIIVFSFLIGLILYGTPMLLIYFRIFANALVPIIFLIIESIIFSLLIIIIRIIDDKKYKLNFGAKWQRKNICKNLGLSLTLIILLISAFLLYNSFNKIIENKKKLINETDNIFHLEYKKDFIIKYIINCFIIQGNNIENENAKFVNYIDYKVANDFYKSLMISCIPLFIFCFNKIIKTIIIKVKYTFSNLLLFISFFLFMIMIYITYYFYDNTDILFWAIISIIEIGLLGFIYIGYIFWTIGSMYKLCKNPKDKNFTIYKYDFIHLFLIFFIGIIDISGAHFIFTSLLLYFLSYLLEHNDDNQDLSIILLTLKIGFILITISNSYYYGYHLLSLIFRPIALQYAPAKLKKNYILVNRKTLFSIQSDGANSNKININN